MRESCIPGFISGPMLVPSLWQCNMCSHPLFGAACIPGPTQKLQKSQRAQPVGKYSLFRDKAGKHGLKREVGILHTPTNKRKGAQRWERGIKTYMSMPMHRKNLSIWHKQKYTWKITVETLDLFSMQVKWRLARTCSTIIIDMPGLNHRMRSFMSRYKIVHSANAGVHLYFQQSKGRLDGEPPVRGLSSFLKL